MDQAQHEHIELSIDLYMNKKRHYQVLDFGSLSNGGDALTHGDLLKDYNADVVGYDVQPGPNVDVVMTKPYRVPVKSNSQDVVITGSTFEHIPFPWVSFMELCRIVKPGGLIFFVAPSRGHIHAAMDFWRYYPDAMRAFAAFGRVRLLESHMDAPPRRPNSRRYDYGRVDLRKRYWGHTVAVFRKPKKYSRSAVLIREPLVFWANRIGGVDGVKRPAPRPKRVKLARTRIPL